MTRTTSTDPTSDARDRGDWQGMNWIRKDKRLAIYLRDGLACAWCGAGIEDGATLTLDHCIPHSKGGSNSEKNLVTCCSTCNSARGNRSMTAFAKAVAAYADKHDAGTILRRIIRFRARELAQYRKQAKGLIESRSSWGLALTGGK